MEWKQQQWKASRCDETGRWPRPANIFAKVAGNYLSVNRLVAASDSGAGPAPSDKIRDVDGWRAMEDVIRRLRDALRPPKEHDVWIGEPPTRDELEDRLGNDTEARALLFDWSMAEFVERYLTDEAPEDRLSRPRRHRH